MNNMLCLVIVLSLNKDRKILKFVIFFRLQQYVCIFFDWPTLFLFHRSIEKSICDFAPISFYIGKENMIIRLSHTHSIK